MSKNILKRETFHGRENLSKKEERIVVVELFLMAYSLSSFGPQKGRRD